MKIRRLSVQEHGITKPLYEEVFPEDSKDFVEYYYTEKTRDNIIYVVEEDGDIQAMLHLNPYSFYINSHKQELHYIVAVATREGYRKRGYMKDLLQEALEDMCCRGEAFTFLMPAAEAIYLPHDFRTVYKQDRRYYRGEGVSSSKAKELQVEECQELADMANAYLAKNYQVFAIRNAQYYERLKKEYAADGGRLMVYRQEGIIVDCRFDVHEEDEERQKIMVRAVDAQKMLESLSLKQDLEVCFHITDPLLEANNRCVFLTGTRASGITVTDGQEESSEGRISISVLTELVFGVWTVDEACKREGVHMTERMKDEIRNVVPFTRLYINEIV